MEMKFYSPIFPKMVYSDCEDYDDVNYWYDNIDSFEATKYEDDIGEKIEMDLSRDPNGLIEYLRIPENKELENALKEKVINCQPTVVSIDGRLYGVMETEVSAPLTQEEIGALKEYYTGQYSDGWGEGFEQRPIKTEDGDLYISFWNKKGFYLDTEIDFARRIGISLEQLTEQKTYREQIADTGISMDF